MNILQRFLARTPVFEKGIQILCLVIIGIAGFMANHNEMSPTLYLILLGACPAVALFAQFATEDLSTVVSAPSLMAGLQAIVASLPGQVEAVISTYKNPPSPAIQDAGAVLGAIAQTINAPTPAAAAPAAPAPVAAAAAVIIPPVAAPAAQPAPIVNAATDQAVNTILNTINEAGQDNVIQMPAPATPGS